MSQDKSLDLSPCPFCGGKAKHVTHHINGGQTYYVNCNACGVSTTGEGNESPALAAECWNRRADHLERTGQSVTNDAALLQACDLLSTTVGILMGYRRRLNAYVEGSAVAKHVEKVVAFLEPWPEKLPDATPPEAATLGSISQALDEGRQSDAERLSEQLATEAAARATLACKSATAEAAGKAPASVPSEPPPHPGQFTKWTPAEADAIRRWGVALALGAQPLKPEEHDELPPLGSKVEIHLASTDSWVEHTVVGYYVWTGSAAYGGTAWRVFVRVMDANGYLNARDLSSVRRAALAAQPRSTT